jgi:hypothetical protein|tara:strand:- start:238 stop:639 length:402 start_codon:yes stop_codon:yes gene_type:complete
MKFEANIPSYLRTGQGVFPVKGRTATAADTDVSKDANFFELMKKGVNMPVDNQLKGTESAPLGSPGMNEPLDIEGFLKPMQEKMQKFKPRMEIEPKIDPKFGTDPVMPQIKPQILKEPDQMEVKAEDADIFIG